ncbi:AAA family ATPase [Actinacidiphila alni]|uniref:AAA family ATPase n=1 Tax=Actinacidiphila alni TaxID=380248 RepID=UPI0033F287ED
MPDQPLFESLEGLRGTGKSTVAPLLAAARGAVLIPTVPALYQPLRREIDARDNVEARMAFYLSALFTATDDIRAHLSAGTPVVVDSYFARCLANHRAYGSRLGITLPPDLPEPVTYSLVCDETERRRRLAARHKPTSRWDGLAEEIAEQITHAYAPFPMHRVNTTGRTPEQIVHAILDVTAQGVSGADPEPVGAHPHLLPPVPRGSVGTRWL